MKRPRHFVNILQVPHLLYTVIRQLKKQRKFIKANVSPDLEAAKNKGDGSLNDHDLKKITGYYGLAVPAILGEAFCALRGRPMTKKERIASTCQGVITGLGDDFFDKQQFTNEALIKLIADPGNAGGKNAYESLSLQYLNKALAFVPDPQWMQNMLMQVYHAQVLSKRQSQNGLGYDEIKDITQQKGAVSLLFYRTAFKDPMEAREAKLLYCLGALMQLSNDIFDVYKDQQQGISTLLTTTTHISRIRLLFLTLLKICYEAAFATGYPRRNIKKFLDILSIAIFSRCQVCLDQLEKNEQRSNHVFTVTKYKRKDMVCDMDTILNKWRSVRYHIRYAP